MVLGRGLALVFTGLVLGLGGALALTRLVSGWLYGVSATDPLTFAGVPIFVMVVATCACLIPARRATMVDPLTALRNE
jgi:putative ABC transport system permease protein